MKDYRLISEGAEARKKMKAGLDRVYNIVRVTLGRISRYVMINQKGKIIPIDVSDRVVAFSRVYDGKRLVTVANFDPLPTNPIPVGRKTTLIFGQARTEGKTVSVPGRSFVLLEENT